MRNVIGGSVPWTVTSWKVGLISSNKLGCSTELNDQIQKSYPKNTESMGKNLCVVDLQFNWILPKKRKHVFVCTETAKSNYLLISELSIEVWNKESHQLWTFPNVSQPRALFLTLNRFKETCCGHQYDWTWIIGVGGTQFDHYTATTMVYTFLDFFKKWAIPGLFLFIFVFSTQLTVNVQYKILPMTGSELRISGFGIDRSTIWAKLLPYLEF